MREEKRKAIPIYAKTTFVCLLQLYGKDQEKKYIYISIWVNLNKCSQKPIIS